LLASARVLRFELVQPQKDAPLLLHHLVQPDPHADQNEYQQYIDEHFARTYASVIKNESPDLAGSG